LKKSRIIFEEIRKYVRKKGIQTTEVVYPGKCSLSTKIKMYRMDPTMNVLWLLFFSTIKIFLHILSYSLGYHEITWFLLNICYLHEIDENHGILCLMRYYKK